MPVMAGTDHWSNFRELPTRAYIGCISSAILGIMIAIACGVPILMRCKKVLRLKENELVIREYSRVMSSRKYIFMFVWIANSNHESLTLTLLPKLIILPWADQTLTSVAIQYNGSVLRKKVIKL